MPAESEGVGGFGESSSILPTEPEEEAKEFSFSDEGEVGGDQFPEKKNGEQSDSSESSGSDAYVYESFESLSRNLTDLLCSADDADVRDELTSYDGDPATFQVPKLPDDSKLFEAGTFVKGVRDIYLIQAVTNNAVLDVETNLFLSTSDFFGTISDVFGQVNSPFYVVFKNEFMKMESLQPGDKLYFTDYFAGNTVVVRPEVLIGLPGSDASWQNDVEVPSWLEEFSDDEVERLMKKKRKNPRDLNNGHRTNQQNKDSRFPPSPRHDNNQGHLGVAMRPRESRNQDGVRKQPGLLPGPRVYAKQVFDPRLTRTIAQDHLAVRGFCGPPNVIQDPRIGFGAQTWQQEGVIPNNRPPHPHISHAVYFSQYQADQGAAEHGNPPPVDWNCQRRRER